MSSAVAYTLWLVGLPLVVLAVFAVSELVDVWKEIRDDRRTVRDLGQGC